MKIKFLVMGGILLLFGAAFADIGIATYQVDGFESDNLEVGATFEVTVQYTNNTGSGQTIVGALFYFDYDTTYLDEITDSAISSDTLSSYLTSKTNSNFTPSSGQFRYQRDAGSGDGMTVSDGATIDCFTIEFHVKQDDSLAGSQTLFEWIYPSDENVILTVAGGTNVTGTIATFQTASLRASSDPTFSGVAQLMTQKQEIP